MFGKHIEAYHEEEISFYFECMGQTRQVKLKKNKNVLK
jgi:hypothetical protein